MAVTRKVNPLSHFIVARVGLQVNIYKIFSLSHSSLLSFYLLPFLSCFLSLESSLLSVVSLVRVRQCPHCLAT